MANNYVIEAESRTVTGKKVKQLRRQGLTPAIIYGEHEPVAIQVNSLQTYLTLRNADANDLLTVKLGESEHSVLARDVQRHVTRGDLIHIDFLEVSKDTMIRAEVTIITHGKSQPEIDGHGITSQLLYSIEIEAPADRLISEIQVDLSQITDPDQVIHVADLDIPEGIELLTDPELPIAKFDYHRADEELDELDEPVEEGDEVELVSDEDDDEEAEE